MAPETSEITTRDVLQQINRRLELIESDVRVVSEKLDGPAQTLRDESAASYRSLNEKWDASVQGLNERLDTSFQTLNDKIDTSVQTLNNKIDTYFRWTIGIVLASWLSTMSAILFKGSL